MGHCERGCAHRGLPRFVGNDVIDQLRELYPSAIGFLDDHRGAARAKQTGVGVLMQSANGVLVGGTTPAAGNTIAFNLSGGVINTNAFGTLSTQDVILSNRIYGNGGLGIDLDGNGVATLRAR